MFDRLFYIVFIWILISCSPDRNKSGAVSDSNEKIKAQAIKITENHIRDQFKKAKKTETSEGLIVYSENNTKCLIDPAYVICGEINDDSYLDAIVSIFIFRDQSLALTEHLILINKDGKLVTSKVLDGDMKFLSIKERVIYVETSKIASDSPLYGCQICKEVIKYQFLEGDTVRIK